MFISIGSYANKPSMESETKLPTNQTHSKNIEHKPVDQSLENLQAFDTSNLAFFNPSSLFGQSNRNINLDSFKVKNRVIEGTYFVQLNINQEKVTDTQVKFIKAKNKESAVLCVDQNLLTHIDLTENSLSKLPSEDCIEIQDINSSAYYEMDVSKLVLNLYVPQAIRIEHPEGYINPKLFDQGINSSFLSYNYNTNHNEERTTQYLSLNAGSNFKGWYFRHQGNFDSDNSGLGRYRSYENVLHTDITPIYSRLSLGQFSTQNYQLESLPIVGAQIASDQTMLPWSQQIYSPVIENVANSNALVKVYQNGIKIYERTVPAGPFKITDLGSIGSGNLIVEIVENNGEVKTYTVPLQQNVNMIKPGRYNYSVSLGKYRLLNDTTDEVISQLNYGYGLNNHLTLLSGLNISEHYNSVLIGAAINSNFGAMNVKVNASQAKIFLEKYDGNQFSFDYIYQFDDLDFSVFLNSLYQDRNYVTASNTFSKLNFDDLSESEINNYKLTNNLKNQYSINLMKSKFRNSTASFNLGYSQNSYWDNTKNAQQFNISYSNLWKKLSYTLGYAQTDYSSFSTDDKTLYMSLSVPLDWKENRAFISSNIQNTQNENVTTTANVNLSGSVGDLNNFNYGIGLSNIYQNNHSETSLQANVNYLLPKISLGATAFATEDKQQYSLSAKGAIVAHRYGITPVNTLAETYTIVHVENGEGARLNNAWGVKLDRQGNAIYPTSSAYSENDISIDPQDLPIDVVLESNQMKVIPKKYSSTLATFKAKQTSNLLLRIQTSKGINLPIGTQVRKQDGSFIGMLGQSNQVILEESKDVYNQLLTVVWGENMEQSCHISPIPSPKTNKVKKNYQFEILKVECN